MKFWTILFLLVVTSAQAQQAQQPDPAQMQKAIQVLQLQRNQAWDTAATAQMEVAKLNEELTKLKAEMEKLKKEKPDAK